MLPDSSDGVWPVISTKLIRIYVLLHNLQEYVTNYPVLDAVKASVMLVKHVLPCAEVHVLVAQRHSVCLIF